MAASFTTQPKNWPAAVSGIPFEKIGEQGWQVLEDFATPIATLDRIAIEHNVESIALWCREWGISIAPHGKTTMSPELVGRQVSAGAWAITAATPWQARQMVDWNVGVTRILLANVCVQPAPLTELLREPVEVLTLVDSPETVRRTAAAVSPGLTLQVLIEVGTPGGRCGVRELTEGLAVADAVAREPALQLVGVAAFEGTVTGRQEAAVESVRRHIAMLSELARTLIRADAFAGDGPVILSAGGSMYPDLVLDGLAGDFGREVLRLVRSGCSLIHDHGLYADASPARPDVRPAMRVWSRVLSVPEPGWAIIDAGKRDITADPPARVLAVHRSADTRLPGVGLVVDHHNDQHGYVRFDEEDLRVGDVLELGISHPCLTFDRWTHIPVIDEDLHVVDVVRTYF